MQGLYDAGGAGSVVFESLSDMSSCPQGTAAPPRGATAVVLLADSSSGAAVLKRSLDGLMLLYSKASPDIRAGFHLYIGLDEGDQDMQQLAQQYVLDSLGALKLLHHRRSSGSAGKPWHDGSSSSGGQLGRQGPGPAEGSSSSSGEGVGHLVQPGGATRADHVQLMLHVALDCFQYPSVLLLEDDWKLLPDFFAYFDAARWLLVSSADSGVAGPAVLLAAVHHRLTAQKQWGAQHSLRSGTRHAARMY